LKWSISLYGSSVRGTWKMGSFTGEPEGYVQQGSGEGHLFPWGPLGEPESGLIYQGLRLDDGSGDGYFSP